MNVRDEWDCQRFVRAFTLPATPAAFPVIKRRIERYSIQASLRASQDELERYLARFEQGPPPFGSPGGAKCRSVAILEVNHTSLMHPAFVCGEPKNAVEFAMW